MKKFADEGFMYKKMISRDMIDENIRQLEKWGIQKRTLPEWLMFLGEEIGELNKACAEYIYRDGSADDIYTEAIQCCVLSAKIAEMIEIQGKEREEE